MTIASAQSAGLPARSTKGRFATGILWTTQVLFGVFFAGSGFGKTLFVDNDLFAQAPDAVSWYGAVPQSLIVLIGVCEVLGGLGLILPTMSRVRPSLTPLAAAGLGVTMALATGFHLIRAEIILAGVTLVLTAIVAYIAWGRARNRPVPAQPLTFARGAATSAALLAIIFLVFLPTWYTATNTNF